MGPVSASLSFRRVVDVPFETCVAALDSWQRTEHGGELRSGAGQVPGPMQHDPESGTCRIEIRLARGPLRPPPADATGYRPLVRIVHRFGAHPLRARPAHRGILPGRPSPA